MTTIFQLTTLVLSFAALIISIVVWFKVSKENKRLDKFFSGNSHLDLERLLNDMNEGVNLQEKKIHELITKIEQLRNQSSQYIYKIGLERFNPFNETGGDQSFVLVLLNQYNSGLIISSLHSRENTRIYAKEVVEGKSSRKLSTEEETLLNKTVSQK